MFRSRPPRPASGVRHPRFARPWLEELEERAVPTTGPFFLDQNNALWAATSATGGFVNTGGFGVALAASQDAAGNQFAAVLDGNHDLHVYDHGTWTDTGRTAMQVVAGLDEIFIRDPANHVQVWNLTVQTWRDTGGFATNLSLGQVTLLVDPGFETGVPVYKRFDVLTVSDANNRLYVYAPVLLVSTPSSVFYTLTWTDTGGYAVQFTVGYKGETVIRDGSNQVLVFQPSINTAGGTWTNTGGFALDLDVGMDQNNNDIVTVIDGNHHMSVYTLTSTPTWTATDLPLVAHLAAGWGEVFTLDAYNQLWMYSTTTGAWSMTGGWATAIHVTTPSTTATDQVSMLDANSTLYLYNGSFTDTMLTAVAVAGFTGRSG
jgi:hypothetical protein